jgi:alanine racemase
VSHPTRAIVHLDRLARNLQLLGDVAGGRTLWPCIKANAYGHGAEIVARQLVALGYDTLCVAHASEALELRSVGIGARLVLLSPALPEVSDAVVEHGLEPVVCTHATLEALSRSAQRAGREVAAHLKVDTGMGRVGVRPDGVEGFLEDARRLAGVRVRGLMSHFPRADEADKSFSRGQIETFRRICEATRDAGIEVRHLANSAGIFDLPDSHFDAVRPGIAIYGLAPSRSIANPRVAELEPVLEWQTRITFLKDTMDQTLVDVTSLRGEVELGDEVVLIGRQGDQTASADALAETLGTIHYEVVTAISRRVPRIASGEISSEAT